MKLTNNDLRAVAGIILLILGIIVLFTRDEVDSLNYILIGLAGFLVGGQLFSPKEPEK
jgi:dipeptide/tripeptide permease